MVDMKKKATDILEDYSNSYSQVDLEILTKFLEQIKSEAIKEFAENAKKECYATYDEVLPSLFADIIDNLVKEMTEVNENE